MIRLPKNKNGVYEETAFFARVKHDFLQGEIWGEIFFYKGFLLKFGSYEKNWKFLHLQKCGEFSQKLSTSRYRIIKSYSKNSLTLLEQNHSRDPPKSPLGTPHFSP